MAKQRPINTSSAEGASFDQGLNTDINGRHRKPNQWTHARNAVNNTVSGDLGELSNEASNYLCAAAPYTIIGTIHLMADAWAIFSTDDVNSEIGIFEEDSCSYETVVNDPCLAFKKNHLVKGVGRTIFDCGRQVYWDDGINPSRVLNLDDVPWVQSCVEVDSCTICEDTDVLDCDKIRLAPLTQDLAFKVSVGSSSGQLINGSYYVVGAYLIEGQRVTDYSLPSNVQGLFQHDNIASSLDIEIAEADQNFDEFELILVQFANFNTVARRIGVYSTRQKKITLDQIDETLPTIDPGLLLIQNNVADKTDAIFRNGEYLLRTGPTEKFDFNYQPLANQITSKWNSVEYPADYYRKGGTNTGYMRDEGYPFFIRFVFDTADKSRSYHIPGPAALPTQTSPVSGGDVLPDDGDGAPELWQVYNTATADPVFPGIGTVLDDGGVIIAGGDMAYVESTEIYDNDNPRIWNATSDPMWGSNDAYRHDLCGKPIRHHKFPDNATDTSADITTNHYNPNDGTKIRILGVQFDNIKPPLDNQGVPISNIVGYEILRGSREGNKTVLAKGMVNNLREYASTDQNPTKRFLYPNYPYNPTAPAAWPNAGGSVVLDHYLSSQHTSFNPRGGSFATGGNPFTNTVNGNNAFLEDDTPLGQPIIPPQGGYYFPENTNILNDMLTFHSPETNFRNPFLSAKEIKVYGELQGDMNGRFQVPKDHPKHKFITNMAFLVSAIIGIGYAMISTEGVKTTAHHAPQTDFGGTFSQVGATLFGTTGYGGPSVIPATVQVLANSAASVSQGVSNKLLSHSMLSMLQNVVGWDPNIANDLALQTAGEIAGSTGGTGSKQVYSRETTPWGATPDLLRVVQGIPAFLTYYSEGVNKMLNVIYAFTPHRQYALQQISHCFYNRFAIPDIGNTRRGIDEQNYLNPELQDFAQDFRINNLFRSRTVALKLSSDLNLPYKYQDDTQALFSDVWPRSDERQWKNEDFVNASFERPASSHYVAMKQRLDNQYGQLAGITQVPVSTDHTPLAQTQSNVLFGGDTYIGRYTEKNTMFFFYDWLNKQPDGATFNYKLRKMITHPRFWMDTDPFDIGEFVSSLGTIFSSAGTPPGGFEPFMIDPSLNIADPGGAGYISNPVCECGTYTDCFFTAADLDEICDLEEEQLQLQLYRDFLQECACFVNVTSPIPSTDSGPDDDPCNEQNDVPNPALEEPFSTDCNPAPPFSGGCATCPDLGGLFKDNDAQAALYLGKNKGNYNRIIKRLERRIDYLGKKVQRKKKKLYDEYLDSLDGNQENFWGKLTDGIVTPGDKYAFDMRKPGSVFAFGVKQAWMYLFNSGVRDFFVESEINIDYRDWGDKPAERHYDHSTYTNLAEMFSTEADQIKVGNHMKYDYSLSVGKLFNNFVSWGTMQDREYDPDVAETCHVYRPKRVMYSLPQSLENKKDNWRVFLPLNYKDFNSVVTNIKPIGKNGAMILFENESPVQFVGVDQLQTDAGTKITIGDGGLFSQPLQNLQNAEYPHEFGSCQNRLSVANTPMGLFYISQNQGKIFQVGERLREISLKNAKWWFAKYLPYQLTKDFPDFELTDNPVVGIGCQTIYDNENEVVFFTKKDYKLRKDILDTVTYLGGRVFQCGNAVIELGDPCAFEAASWTTSYDPKTEEWVAYHDWHPDLVLPSKKTYMTTKDNGLWVHADRCDSYCNFYGVDYPFEIEYALHTNTDVNTLRNVLYFMETYVYEENCDDRFHVLDFNFDEAIVFNSEQCSGLLKLNLEPKNNAPEILTYPRINFQDIDILFSKEEHKYRFNQFWDITDDRGEFTNVRRSIFKTAPNGYIRDLNPNNLNYNKFALERKRFRHYKNSVLLRRKVSGDKQMTVALGIQMNLKSPR